MKRNISDCLPIAKNSLKVLSALGLALILLSCDKEDGNNKPADLTQNEAQINTDVREKYVGDFQISLHHEVTSTGTSTGPATTSTSDYEFVTSVYYNKQDSMKIYLETKSYPKISFKTINRPIPMFESLGLEDSTGNLYNVPPRGHYNYHGGFINPDSINFSQIVNNGRDRWERTFMVGKRIK